jgi:F-type H+-transporting ATPase subunit c
LPTIIDFLPAAARSESRRKEEKKMKKIISGLTTIMLVGLPALASAAEAAAAGGGADHMKMFAVALGAGLAIGIGALGGALGQGRAAAAALEGIARNPGAAGKITTPMIIGLALIESLVIYSLIVSLLMVFKL